MNKFSVLIFMMLINLIFVCYANAEIGTFSGKIEAYKDNNIVQYSLVTPQQDYIFLGGGNDFIYADTIKEAYKNGSIITVEGNLGSLHEGEFRFIDGKYSIVNVENNTKSNFVGPTIKGFALGMSLNDVEEICQKRNCTVEEIDDENGIPIRWVANSGLLYFIRIDKNRIVNEMEFYPGAFGVTNISEDIIKKFLTAYNINTENCEFLDSRGENTFFILRNNEDGYQIIFRTYNIELSIIAKLGKQVFD